MAPEPYPGKSEKLTWDGGYPIATGIELHSRKSPNHSPTNPVEFSPAEIVYSTTALCPWERRILGGDALMLKFLAGGLQAG